jgi:hypothetical protein
LRTINWTIAGKRATGYWYLRGPYNMTVGHALRFEGDAQDRAYVASVSEKIMQQIISLADESEQRMQGHRSSPNKTKNR